MNVENILWDVKHLASQLKSSSRFPDRFIIEKIDNYRALEIGNEYGITNEINPTWLQNNGRFICSKVSSSDMEVPTSICLGKVTLPPVVNLPQDKGVHRISSSAGHLELFPIEESKLYVLIEANDFTLKHYTYYFRRGIELFIYPYLKEINAVLINESPLSGYVFTTELVTAIKAGELYVVSTGSVTYNGVTYIAPNGFTGVSGVTTFTGGGTVKYASSKRAMRLTDQYPIDRALAQRCIINILTKDFQIETQQVHDVIQDNADQLNLFKTFGKL